MPKYCRRFLLAILIITGALSIAVPGGAAPVSFGVEGTFTYDDYQFDMEGKVKHSGDVSLIPTDTSVSFTSIWDGGAFTESVLSIGTDIYNLDIGGVNSIKNLGNNSIFIGGAYLIAPETLIYLDITLGLLTGTIADGEDIDMAGSYSGNMVSTITFDTVSTPVPASITLLGLGLIALSSIRRRTGSDPIQNVRRG